MTMPCSSNSTTQRLNDSHAASAAGLYIHVPFCRTKCVYCDFYSITGGPVRDDWLKALEREMALYRNLFTHFGSLYIGGGTPSLLNTRQTISLLTALHTYFAFSPDAEITVEVNPDDAAAGKFLAMKSLGVNRLSFGVQSCNDGELAFLKRRHTSAAAERAIEMARKTGFSNIGLDLMYGLPGQTRKTWLETLEQALSFRPTHLSCYQLTLEGETPLKTMVSQGKVHLPDEEEARRLFLLTSRFLESRGFAHYEVSNYAISADFFCRHNEKYWRHVPYLGLGPAAHSFDGRQRWWNERSVSRYCDALARGERPVEECEILSPEQLKLERLYLGLRTSRGIHLEDLPPHALPAIERLRKAGLIKLRSNMVIPSRRGFLVADSLPILLS